MIQPLGQNVLIEKNKDQTELVKRASGLVQSQEQLKSEGLLMGTVIIAPQDQSLLIDFNRPITPGVTIKAGDQVWYSEYSAGHILDDRDGHQGELLDLVPLEDIRALVS